MPSGYTKMAIKVSGTTVIDDSRNFTAENVRLNGSTSGFVELEAPATAANNTLVLPNGNGTDGQVLTTDGNGNLSWEEAVAGATGAGNDRVFFENGQVVTTSYTIGNNGTTVKNAMSAGPITVNPGVTVTIPPGQAWTIV